jgi:hypothetical protein
MKHNRKTANVLSALLATATCVASWVFYTYLPISPERLKYTFGCLLIGILVTVVFYATVTWLPNEKRVRIALVSAFGLLATTPLVSAVAQRITYSHFGFTVYGMVPVPVLDITVNRYGILWFRPKTHLITRQELDAMVGADVEIVVVGVGWDSIAQLTDDAKLISSKIDLRILPTPAAFALFNKLKAEGRIVVLLAHSTC